MAFAKERENFVYIAKLAEQAERYEGTFSRSVSFWESWLSFLFLFCLLNPNNLFGCRANPSENRKR